MDELEIKSNFEKYKRIDTANIDDYIHDIDNFHNLTMKQFYVIEKYEILNNRIKSLLFFVLVHCITAEA